ncbi:MAG: glycosyltransferase family A protein [Clostridiales bacterium]|nr:glycosyltransferase family A protein [Clostridiales bacterium]MDU6975021.1 glycosyltransferase family A protein [Clostridiales bacterium]
MRLQVLVATMNQKDFSLHQRMNIQSDAIIANQCDKMLFKNITVKDKVLKYLCFNERGVGLNRNNALMRADSEVCLIADDDLVFVDGYEEIVIDTFRKNKDADVIIFNLMEDIPKRFVIRKKMRIRFNNYMRFGAARVAFKRESILKNNIYFSLNFGGGAKYSAGEDTLFLKDCLKHNLKIIAVPVYIAKLVEYRESTWFEGYNAKFFMDRGALFSAISKRWSWLLCLQFVVRRRSLFKDKMSMFTAYKLMKQGAKEYKVY